MFSFVKNNLETKVIVAIGAILTALLGAYAFVDIWTESRATYSIVYKDLDTLSNTIQKSLIKDMRDGKSSDVQEIMEAVGTERDILAARIFAANGTILKSRERGEIGRAMPEDAFANFRAGRHDYITEKDGYEVFHILHPIANAPPCYGCHDKEKEINGVLSIDYSLEAVQKDLRPHLYRMAAVFALTIMLVALAIFALLKKMVHEPITGLKAAMAEAELGNLEIVIPAVAEDEIGSLQKSFNNMLARIKGLNEENLSQQKDLVKKEQELQMQQVLEQKNKALETVNKEVVEKNLHYMEMLSFISHELKNPLVVLKGYSGLLIKGDLGPLEEAQSKAVEAMDRNIDALNEMIADYMDLSRVEKGEFNPEKRDIDLADDVIKPVIAQYEPVVRSASMTIRAEGAAVPLIFEADPGLMRSALGNLVSNAVKYGRAGSDILVEIEPSEGAFTLAVFNEGDGIPYDKLGKIFERFTRLETEGSRSQKGTGLGLYIVREIIQMHGGTVRAESLEGSWTKIVCTIPVPPRRG